MPGETDEEGDDEKRSKLDYVLEAVFEIADILG